jgi:hypothetical protein
MCDAQLGLELDKYPDVDELLEFWAKWWGALVHS